MTISVIIPTIGRDQLPRAVASVAVQLQPGDEILILRDETGDSGNTPRDDATKRAKGTHLWFLDDDDVACKRALTAMREAADEHPKALCCFKMLYGKKSEAPGMILWERKSVEPGQLGTPCCLIPNLPNLPLWTEANDELIFSDIRYLMKVAARCRDVVWFEDVVAHIRP